MTTEELETLMEARAESQHLDFKTDCPWNVNTFAKHILAMSNLQDGGRMIIGVEDKTLRRIGISSANRATFDIDVMRDQIASLADPHAIFRVDFPKGRDGKDYAVITVLPFREIPVICKKDSPPAGVTAGVVYYRNSTRRVESAAVSNSTDMRDIIELATVRMMQRRAAVGYSVLPDDAAKLEAELDGL